MSCYILYSILLYIITQKHRNNQIIRLKGNEAIIHDKQIQIKENCYDDNENNKNEIII